MVIKIKNLIIESGIVDDVQQYLSNDLKNKEIIGKQIDIQTASDIKKIREETINESLIETKNKLIESGIRPSNVKATRANGLKGVLNAERGTKDVLNAAGKAGQGLPPGSRSKTELNENVTMRTVKPLPKRPSGALVEARNEKNAILKDQQKIPSAYTMLKNNPTHRPKPGQLVNRDLAKQTNRMGEGVT